MTLQASYSVTHFTLYQPWAPYKENCGRNMLFHSHYCKLLRFWAGLPNMYITKQHYSPSVLCTGLYFIGTRRPMQQCQGFSFHRLCCCWLWWSLMETLPGWHATIVFFYILIKPGQNDQASRIWQQTYTGPYQIKKMFRNGMSEKRCISFWLAFEKLISSYLGSFYKCWISVSVKICRYNQKSRIWIWIWIRIHHRPIYRSWWTNIGYQHIGKIPPICQPWWHP